MKKAYGKSYYDTTAKEIVLKIKPSIFWFLQKHKCILICKDDLEKECNDITYY